MENWCGTCGISSRKIDLRLFMVLPDGEKSYVCVKRKQCLARFNRNLKQAFRPKKGE